MPYEIFSEQYVEIHDLQFFSFDATFDCGQSFRFEKKGDFYIGVAGGRVFKGVQLTESSIRIYNPSDYPFWKSFLALDEDYLAIRESMPLDDTMKNASLVGSGIRILRQDKWEALCSFIISQNNNIPRIKKLVEALSQRYGDEILFDGEIYHSFPSAKKLALVPTEELFDLKLGFRAPYIKDAAVSVANGTLDLDYISSLPADSATEALKQIKGVGPKVAACTLLYGFYKTDMFPIDVWVKRILDKYYSALPYDKAPEYFGKYAGIAQQYLFYYERYSVAGKG